MACFAPLFFFLAFRFSNAIKSIDTNINLEFIVPASDQVIIATLSSEHNKDVSFYKIIRSVLYINDIVMDCSFTFDPKSFSHYQTLTCDINNACISHLNLNGINPIKLHFENLGIGDITIIEIKQKDSKTNYQKSLFYDGLICIGDSDKCDGHRYIDFISNKETKHLEISPINSQIHNKLQCNSKDTKYGYFKKQNNSNSREEREENENENEYEHEQKQQKEQILGSKRQILAINYNHYNNNNHYHHKYYMDILLTIVLLAMIVISVYNMSYAFNHFKGNDVNNNNTLRYQYYDTRRV